MPGIHECLIGKRISSIQLHRRFLRVESRVVSTKLSIYIYHYIFSGGLHISREAKKQSTPPKQLINRSLSVSIHTAYMLLVAAMIWNSLCSVLWPSLWPCCPVGGIDFWDRCLANETTRQLLFSCASNSNYMSFHGRKYFLTISSVQASWQKQTTKLPERSSICKRDARNIFFSIISSSPLPYGRGRFGP